MSNVFVLHSSECTERSSECTERSSAIPLYHTTHLQISLFSGGPHLSFCELFGYNYNNVPT